MIDEFVRVIAMPVAEYRSLSVLVTSTPSKFSTTAMARPPPVSVSISRSS